MPRGSNFGSGRAGAGPRPEPGTIPESLSEIREILHGLDRCGGGDAPPLKDETDAAARSNPAADAPDAALDGAIANPGPVPASPVAPPPRRGFPAFAALTVAGLALLGAAGLVVAGGPNLSDLAASASGKGQSRAGDRSEVVARAVLPPTLIAAAATGGAAAPSPKAAALPNIDMGSWQPPPAAETGTASPAGAPGTRNRFEGGGHGRGPVAAVAQGGAAAALAQPQKAHRSPHAAQNKAAPESRRDGSAHWDRLARRSSPAIAGSENSRPRLRKEPTHQPKGTKALPVARRWNRVAARLPAGEADSGIGKNFASVDQPADQAGKVYQGSEADPGPTAPDRAGYAPAAEPPRGPVAWSNRGFSPGVTVVDAFPPFAPPPPPPPRFRYRLRAFPFAPPPRFRYGPGAGPPFPPRWRPPFPYRWRFALP